MEFEQQPQTKMQKFRHFISECIRVLKVTKKPTGVEFKTIVKVSGIGIGIIGFVGFVVHVLKVLLFQQ